MVPRRLVALAAAMAIAVTSAVVLSTRVYIVAAIDNDAQLLWDSHEALVFASASTVGRSMTYWRLGWEFVNNYLGAVTPPEKKRTWVSVIRYTRTGIETHVLQNTQVGPLSIFEGRVYNGRGDLWNGRDFVPQAEAEIERFYAAMRTYNPFVSHDGWTKRSAVLQTGRFETSYPMRIDGDDVEFVVSHPDERDVIEIRRNGDGPRRVWALDGSWKYVTKAEYERTFSRD